MLKCIVGVALGVVVPEEDEILGIELAVGKDRHGETGVEPKSDEEAVLFWGVADLEGVAVWSRSAENDESSFVNLCNASTLNEQQFPT